jgi:hypothetical protein
MAIDSGASTKSALDKRDDLKDGMPTWDVVPTRTTSTLREIESLQGNDKYINAPSATSWNGIARSEWNKGKMSVTLP